MEAPEQVDILPAVAPEAAESLLPPPAQLTLPDAVRQALEAKNFKPKCPACPSIGWATLDIFAAPAAIPTYLQNMHIPIALLVCKRCGHISPHSLNAIGVTVQIPEAPRVITPDQVRQQTPQLVRP